MRGVKKEAVVKEKRPIIKVTKRNLLLGLFICNWIVFREKGEVAELLQVLSNKIDLENMAEEGNLIWSQLWDYDDNSD